MKPYKYTWVAAQGALKYDSESEATAIMETSHAKWVVRDRVGISLNIQKLPHESSYARKCHMEECTFA